MAHPFPPSQPSPTRGEGVSNLLICKGLQKTSPCKPPAGGGEVGGSGTGRGTRARSVCLGFPPPTCLAPLRGRSALRASPRWGEARSRSLAPRAPSGMFFCRNCLSAAPRKCQFGEGEHAVFAGDTVPKTLALFLKQSTKFGVEPWGEPLHPLSSQSSPFGRGLHASGAGSSARVPPPPHAPAS